MENEIKKPMIERANILAGDWLTNTDTKAFVQSH